MVQARLHEDTWRFDGPRESGVFEYLILLMMLEVATLEYASADVFNIYVKLDHTCGKAECKHGIAWHSFCIVVIFKILDGYAILCMSL